MNNNFSNRYRRRNNSPKNIIITLALAAMVIIGYSVYYKVPISMELVEAILNGNPKQAAIKHSEKNKSNNNYPENKSEMPVQDTVKESSNEEHSRVSEENQIRKSIDENQNRNSNIGGQLSDLNAFFEAGNAENLTEKNFKSTANQKNEYNPRPVPRRTNPFEDTLMNDVVEMEYGGSFKSANILDGYFKGLSKIAVKNSFGIKELVFKGFDIYQFSFFPPVRKYAVTELESYRNKTAFQAFPTLYDIVHGDGKFGKNKENLKNHRVRFSNECATYKEGEWKFFPIDGFSYGCSKYGFTVIPDEAVGKPGILNSMNDAAMKSNK